MILIFHFFFLLNSVSSFFKQSDVTNSFFKKEIKENFKLYQSENNYYIISKDASVYDENLHLKDTIEQTDSRRIYFYYRFSNTSLFKILRESNNRLLLVREGIKNFSETLQLIGNPQHENLFFFQHVGTEYLNILIYHVTKEKPHIKYLNSIYVDNLKFSAKRIEWDELKEQNAYYRNYSTKLLSYNNEFRFIIFQYVFFFTDKTSYLRKTMYPGSNENDIYFVPFMDFFKTKDYSNKPAFLINTIYETPIFCSDNTNEEGWGFKIYSQITDVALSNEEELPAFFFISDNQLDQALCFIDRYKIIDTYKTYEENEKLNCTDLSQLKFCKYSDVMLFAKPIFKFKSKTYKRVFIKTLTTNSKVSYIIFLLDQLNRFVVYDYIYIMAEKQFVSCFEGVFNLINRETTDILDIVLDDEKDQFIIVTSFYVQKIPLTLFCSEHSKSSCVFGESTCSIGKKLSKTCMNKKTGCSQLNKNFKTTSDLFYCDQENKDMCLVLPANQSIVLKHKNQVCKKSLCLCKSISCYPHRCMDVNKKEICFPKKSDMILSSFIDINNIEPVSYLFYSIIISFLSIAFILISIYCCFSNTHVSKIDAQKSEISKVDLSKFDITKSSKKRYK